VHVAQHESRDRLTGALADLLTGPLAAVGLDVEAIETSPAGKRRLLRIAIDKDGGVSLDDVAEATKQVGVLLDSSDVMGQQAYTLEVTSPGIDRPLTLPRHWRRNVGRLVKVTTADGSTVNGRISEAAEDAVVLDVKGSPRTLALSEVAKARVQIEFNRPTSGSDDGNES
jgi:ribosome maturation factor RimP